MDVHPKLAKVAPPPVAGMVRCLRCDREFKSPHKRGIRVCPRCKKESERVGRVGERASTVSRADYRGSGRPPDGGTGFCVPSG